MKLLFVFVSILLLQQNAFAKKGDIPTEADYVVPTTADLVEYSRFKVKIQKPYTGATSDSIAYEFPADITGIEGKTVVLTRIGKTNTWESPEMTASCTESDETFSCNMYLVKKEIPLSDVITKDALVTTFDFGAARSFGCGGPVKMMSFVDQGNVENFLTGSGFTGDIFDKKLAVAKAFACSEPAGILSYEFK